MRKAQKLLLKNIKTYGEVNGDVVKVDRLINHRVDTVLMKAIGQDIARKFKHQHVDKIITVEASGIPPAQSAAFYLETNYIFAKKKMPITMKGFFSAESFSFTKNETTTLYVSKEVLKKGDKILFVDDFYAKGNTFKAVEAIVEEAGAELVGCAVIIDKTNNKDVHSILTLSQIKTELGVDA